VGVKFGEFTHFEYLVKESLVNDQKVIIVSINLDGFSLANRS